MTEPTQGLAVERAHLSVRLNSLFFPLSSDDLYPWAEKQGYNLAEDISRLRPPSLPSGVRMSVVGRIATNPITGNTLVLQTDREFIAIEGPVIQGVLDDFLNLEEWIQKSGKVDLRNTADVRFFEFILDAAFVVSRERSPIETIKRVYSDSRLMAAMNKSSQREVTNFGVRIVEKGRLPTENQWFEIKIEPTVRRPQTEYYVYVVYREPTKEPVVSLATKSPALIEALIADLEGQG